MTTMAMTSARRCQARRRPLCSRWIISSRAPRMTSSGASAARWRGPSTHWRCVSVERPPPSRRRAAYERRGTTYAPRPPYTLNIAYWNGATRRHMSPIAVMSIGQLLSSCCYLFTVLNSGLLFYTKRVSTTPATPSKLRPLPSPTCLASPTHSWTHLWNW